MPYPAAAVQRVTKVHGVILRTGQRDQEAAASVPAPLDLSAEPFLGDVDAPTARQPIEVVPGALDGRHSVWSGRDRMDMGR